MGIAIQRTTDYFLAIEIALERFLPELSAAADWYGPTSSKCYMTFQPTLLGAECFGEFVGNVPGIRSTGTCEC